MLSVLQRLCVPCVKTTTYVCDRFNAYFCTRDHRTNKAISSLNRKFWNKSPLICVDFPVVRFYPLRFNEITSLRKTIPSFEFEYISWILYIRLLSPISNKKFEQEKKSFYKSVSKSIYVDTYYLLFAIVVTECNVLSPSTKFSSLHGTRWWYCKCSSFTSKTDVTCWNMIIPDRNQIHATPNFLHLRS